MYAVIKDGKVICICDYEPSSQDLRKRGETYVFANFKLEIGQEVNNDVTNISRP